MPTLKEVDDLHYKGDLKRAHDSLKKMQEQEPQNAEILWRLARSCYNQATVYENKNPARKVLIVEGHKYAIEAYQLAPKNFNVLKYAAVTTGARCEISGMTERIKLGHSFKSYLDQAIAMTPTDCSLLHMRGRQVLRIQLETPPHFSFSYACANLSWFERKAASTFFQNPPQGSLDDALQDFLEVEKLRPGVWMENLIYVARCYAGKNNNVKAAYYLHRLLQIQPEDAADEEILAEARKLLKSVSK